MNTLELRCGNNLYDIRSNIVTVSATYLNKTNILILEKPSFKYYMKDVFPISLTETKLKQLGFRKEKNIGTFSEYYWTNGIIDLTSSFYLSTFSREYSSTSVANCDKIEYVHQLQNIQYDLRKIELILNIK